MQENSGTPCAGSFIPALTSGSMSLEAQLQEPAPSLAQVTETVWNLRQALTGGLTEAIVEHAHRGEHTRQQSRCPQCDRLLKARDPVQRTVETLVGLVQLERPYFYCPACHVGLYPLDEILGLSPGRTQLDVQKADRQAGDGSAV